jgi:hypothetical protein
MDTYANVTSYAQYKLAAAHKIAQDIWNTLPSNLWYNTYKGCGTCGVGAIGGELDLSKVLEAKNHVNCYDLAAISQAWCASLGKNNNQGPQDPVSISLLESGRINHSLLIHASLYLTSSEVANGDPTH